MERIKTYIVNNSEGETMNGKSLAVSEKDGKVTYHLALCQQRERKGFILSGWSPNISRMIFGGDDSAEFIKVLKCIGIKVPDKMEKDLKGFCEKNPQWEPEYEKGEFPYRISLMFSLKGGKGAKPYARNGRTQFLTPDASCEEQIIEGIYSLDIDGAFSEDANSGTSVYTQGVLVPEDTPYCICDKSVKNWLIRNREATTVPETAAAMA